MGSNKEDSRSGKGRPRKGGRRGKGESSKAGETAKARAPEQPEKPQPTSLLGGNGSIRPTALESEWLGAGVGEGNVAASKGAEEKETVAVLSLNEVSYARDLESVNKASKEAAGGERGGGARGGDKGSGGVDKRRRNGAKSLSEEAFDTPRGASRKGTRRGGRGRAESSSSKVGAGADKQQQQQQRGEGNQKARQGSAKYDHERNRQQQQGGRGERKSVPITAIATKPPPVVLVSSENNRLNAEALEFWGERLSAPLPSGLGASEFAEKTDSDPASSPIMGMGSEGDCEASINGVNPKARAWVPRGVS